MNTVNKRDLGMTSWHLVRKDKEIPKQDDQIF